MSESALETIIATTHQSRDYELLDSGDGQKLERYGSFSMARPDPQALWPKRLPDFAWNKANCIFSTKATTKAKKTAKEWTIKPGTPERWSVSLADLNFYIRPTSFKHVGIFPEQVPNWQWIAQKISARVLEKKSKKVSVLNLFGYTGGATLSAAKAGASVTHVDGSKVAIGWAQENAALSNLSEKPIRWILDDARAFVKREIKRGNRYDAIIMDPPAFGHGPKKEAWKIEEDLLGLLSLSKQVLTENPLFFLINGYASGYSALAYYNSLLELFKGSGTIEKGELTIRESGTGRLLPAGIFARWSSGENTTATTVRNDR